VHETAKRVAHSKLPAARPIRGGRGAASWADSVRRFRDHLEGPGEAARTTRRAYERHLERFRRWWAADGTRKGTELAPGAIVGSDLRDYRDFLRDEAFDPDHPTRRRKAAAVNTIMSPLKSYLGWCLQVGILERLPDLPKRVKGARPGYKAIRPEDQRRILRAIEAGRSTRDMAIAVLLLDCGLRAAELCALRWKDVELTRGRAEVYVWSGKGAKQGAVPLSGRARRLLAGLKDLAAPAPGDPVFLSRQGDGPLSVRGLQHWCKKYGKLCGVEFSPHHFRHACATDMIARGENAQTVRAVLRHGSINTTLGYVNTTPEQIRAAVERGGEDD
jgi:integrase